ncbi:MAG: prolyl oligopeptidase family serine peptidase, partial [Bacteroidaceae bacterium]|nr:prolyl oligopeptidase family serine peptidase [Bacteroidaceae bacterium]
ISGDYAGQCQRDLLSGIDDICKEPYVDKDRLGCVGASFGGYSVYWLAGHHEGRFKAFIAHDGIYNEPQQYVETDELWFPNWDLKAAPWRKDITAAQDVYNDSPHLSVDKWDTPILCIHGMKDYRIMFTQAESAFQAAKMRGIPAQLLLLPDENHWVLHPQNAILWQRTFFGWLDRWLK